MSESAGPGLELLLALVSREASTRCCRGCGASLAAATPAVVEHTLDRVAVELCCASCGAAEAVELRPAAEGGVAQVG